MKFETLKKRIQENSGSKYTSDKQMESDVEFSKNVTDADIELMEREASMVKLLRKPRYYVVVYIFFRYRIPIMYHRIVNFITGR